MFMVLKESWILKKIINEKYEGSQKSQQSNKKPKKKDKIKPDDLVPRATEAKRK